MTKKAFFLFFICQIGWVAAFSQDSLSVVKWDLQTCLDYAKKNNIQVNSARLSQQTSQQELILSRGAALPNLYGSATQYINHYHNDAVYGSGNYGLTSSWTLYQGGYIKSDIQQKNVEVERANLSILQQVNDLTLQITQYYLNILLDKETIIYQQNVVATSQAQVDRAKKRLDAGSIAQKDVAQLLAQLANDKYTLVTAENAQRQDLISLKQLLQLSATSFDVITPDTIISKKAVDNLLNVQQTALKDRPEVKSGELYVRSAEFGLQKANSGYLPTLTASGFAGSSYQGAGSGYFTQLNNGFNQQVGLSLSIPIFTRKINQVNRAQAKINIDQAKLSLKDTKTTLTLTIEKAYINVVNSQNQYDAAAEAFKYNQETYRVANEQLKVGVVNMVDFLQQKNLYTQALQQYIQAKYNAALTIEIYEFYKGTPVKL
ncbi:TolC family protein [Mucilaginibacter psychrotolerans]|uniref:TolC family protein n=1 Tax=Mucilaginibacter psychrotolerans TaxID=1524096 RepID=A0A4Y8SH33_9SPHI|nr:TolC family protein [Mucilaginibacter psychrotolerans]TFF37945.1 TolC family protein [Mucilaginibacter psychrotolerans]